VIKKIAKRQINNIPELQEELSKYRPGDKVLVGVQRKGESKDFLVELRNQQGTIKLVNKETRRLNTVLGADFQNLDKQLKKELELSYGVRVVNLRNGKLRKAGVQDNFIVTKIDSEEIYNEEDVYEILENKKGGVLVEGIYPNGKTGYYGFGM